MVVGNLPVKTADTQAAPPKRKECRLPLYGHPQIQWESKVRTKSL